MMFATHEFHVLGQVHFVVRAQPTLTFGKSKKIHKKQKSSAIDIVEPQSKEMWSVSYVTFIDLIAQVSLTR